MSDLRIEGADALAKVARRLRDIGDRELKRELFRGINRAVKPLKDEAAKGALQTLPRRGGLAAKVAKVRVRVETRTGASTAGVQLRGTVAGMNLRAIDRGQLRHPVFGNREVWTVQSVPAGWWSRTLDSRAADVTRLRVAEAMADVARKATR